MNRGIVVGLLGTILLPTIAVVDAQPTKVYRVGVITQGGPYYEAINGLREELRTAKQIGLTIPPNVLVRADRVIK